jgi:hypothetical protein
VTKKNIDRLHDVKEMMEESDTAICKNLQRAARRMSLQTAELKKVKNIPITGRGGPQGCEKSRLPNFLDSPLTDGSGGCHP